MWVVTAPQTERKYKMSKNPSYKLKARPNLFDLAIMDGFLCGGGNVSNASSVQREAYWAHPQDTLEHERHQTKRKSWRSHLKPLYFNQVRFFECGLCYFKREIDDEYPSPHYPRRF